MDYGRGVRGRCRRDGLGHRAFASPGDWSRAMIVAVAFIVLSASNSSATLHRIDAKIDAADRQRGDAPLALDAMRALRDFAREGGDREAASRRVDFVVGIVDAAIKAQPADAPLLLVEKASLLFNLGRKAEVEPLLNASIASRPNLEAALALMGIYDRRQQRDRIAPLCSQVRPHLFRDAQIFALLDGCVRHLRALTPEAGLLWASDEDKRFYFRELERRGGSSTSTADGRRKPLGHSQSRASEPATAANCDAAQLKEMRANRVSESAIRSACSGQ